MKRVILILALLAAVSSEVFSQEPIYLFEDYTPAVFTLKNRVRTSGRIQIDAKYQKIYYLQGEEVMEMTNCPVIDTLYVDGRKFVWRNDCLCEFLRASFGNLYINWRFRDTPVGKIGAMGTVTRQKVEVMQVPGLNSEYSYANIGKFEDRTDVWTVENENTYFWVREGREYRIRRPSDLYGSFPAKASAIRKFLRSNNLTMRNAEEARRIFEFIYDSEPAPAETKQ